MSAEVKWIMIVTFAEMEKKGLKMKDGICQFESLGLKEKRGGIFKLQVYGLVMVAVGFGVGEGGITVVVVLACASLSVNV